MTKLQIFVVLSAIFLFFALYFGFDTVPPKQKSIEKSRALAQTSTDINNLLLDAKQEISTSSATNLLIFEQQLELATTDSAKVKAYEQLSSAWYQNKQPAIAGYYAEQLAEIDKGEQAWSIAGTTYAICVQREQKEKVKDFCTQRAVKAFENASSLSPEDVQHKLNLATVYTEQPPANNPMKGILMLLDLNKRYPDNVPVLLNLAKQGMRTGQYDKAAGRLEKAYSLAPENAKVVCMLAQIYEELNKKQEAQAMAKQCETLRG